MFSITLKNIKFISSKKKPNNQIKPRKNPKIKAKNQTLKKRPFVKRYPKVTPEGVEPSITWMKARCPRPLDDGADLIGGAPTLRDGANFLAEPRHFGTQAKAPDILSTYPTNFHV